MGEHIYVEGMRGNRDRRNRGDNERGKSIKNIKLELNPNKRISVSILLLFLKRKLFIHWNFLKIYMGG